MARRISKPGVLVASLAGLTACSFTPIWTRGDDARLTSYAAAAFDGARPEDLLRENPTIVYIRGHCERREGSTDNTVRTARFVPNAQSLLALDAALPPTRDFEDISGQFCQYGPGFSRVVGDDLVLQGYVPGLRRLHVQDIRDLSPELETDPDAISYIIDGHEEGHAYFNVQSFYNIANAAMRLGPQRTTPFQLEGPWDVHGESFADAYTRCRGMARDEDMVNYDAYRNARYRKKGAGDLEHDTFRVLDDDTYAALDAACAELPVAARPYDIAHTTARVLLDGPWRSLAVV